MPRLARFLSLLAFCAACVPAGVAVADPYPVTNTDNSGAGSLRAAVLAANSHSGADTIPIETTGTIDLQSALQIIFDPVSIVGPGAELLTIHRDAATTFSVLAFSSSADPSSISGVTVSNGQAIIGGGIRNVDGALTVTKVVVKNNEVAGESDTNVSVEGGGIFSEGPLTLRETVVADNAARASGGTTLTAAFGGGIAALGSLTVEGSTISGNVAKASGAGSVATAQGGGVLAGTEATVTRSTISGNAVVAGGGASQIRAQGGGIQTYEATLTASTLAGNSATSAGLALGANLHSVVGTSVRNTLVSDPLGGADSCSGGGPPGSEEISSEGFNLDEDGSCELDESSDLVGVVAGLDPALKDNGGPTPTHALLAGSIAIDRGNSFGETIDQRGLPRPSDFAEISNKEGGDGADIGAFELQLPPAAAGGGLPVVVTERRTDGTPPQTRIVSGPPRSTFKTKAKFRFASNEAQSHFQCKLDKRKWKACANPFKRSVKPGRHLFKVRAIDRFGNVDPTPARFGWRVKPIVG